MILILYSSLPMPELEEFRFKHFVYKLPLSMQRQVFQYKNRSDSMACLIGKLLIGRGFEHLGLTGSHSLERIQYTTFNRPFIPGSKIDFNVSHSGEYVVCALSDSCKVGIDIEYIKPIIIDDFVGIMRDEEHERIRLSDTPLLSFYQYWTEKESVIKAVGQGLSIPLKKFLISDNETQIAQTSWYLKEIHIADNYICHLATDADGKIQEVIIREELFS